MVLKLIFKTIFLWSNFNSHSKNRREQVTLQKIKYTIFSLISKLNEMKQRQNKYYSGESFLVLLYGFTIFTFIFISIIILINIFSGTKRLKKKGRSITEDSSIGCGIIFIVIAMTAGHALTLKEFIILMIILFVGALICTDDDL